LRVCHHPGSHYDRGDLPAEEKLGWQDKGKVGEGVRSAKILCESRLRWWNGANRLRETASRRLVDAEPGWGDEDAGSVWRLSPGVAPMEGFPERFPEDEAGIGGELLWMGTRVVGRLSNSTRLGRLGRADNPAREAVVECRVVRRGGGRRST
jgi:hypothetical protein